jgi:branched-subunit amino acid aminotransferase/4-amino-4-deoxychorismate lyase
MPIFFDRHYDRMERGARLLRIPFVERDDRWIVKSVVTNSGISDACEDMLLGGLNYYDDASRGM